MTVHPIYNYLLRFCSIHHLIIPLSSAHSDQVIMYTCLFSRSIFDTSRLLVLRSTSGDLY